MAEKCTCTINDLLELFEDSIDPSDVLAAKLMAQVSTSITKERLRLNMNQQDFSKYIHVSQALVSRWEHGECNFSLKKIAEIAALLNLNVDISFHNNSLQLKKGNAEYHPVETFTKVVRYNANPSQYKNKAYSSLKAENTSFNIMEDTNHVAIC